ncbi:MAG TPA: hypothetical protein VFG23_00320 [Polyangia bacterium]|nr:hypothetical protein [Polyangia bacterium]
MKALGPRLRAFSAVLASIAVPTAIPAHASAEVLVSLDYGTDPALAGCPSAADFRREIVRQLGHDPFRDPAPRRVVVRLYSAGPRLGGRVEWRDAHDEWEGERTFSSRNESCGQMARAVALATAIQIQLLARVEGSGPPKLAADSKPPSSAVVVPVPSMRSEVPLPVPAPKEARIAVEVGAGVLSDLGDSPTMVLPRVAVSLGRLSAIGLRLTASGLGLGAQVSRPEGSAQIDRFVMTLELVRFFRAGRIVQPLLAFGAGWQDVRARGTSAMPAMAAAHEGQAFSGVLSGSGGLAFALASRLFAVVEAQAILFRPSVTVQVGSSEAAHLDGAAFGAHGGLLARF